MRTLGACLCVGLLLLVAGGGLARAETTPPVAPSPVATSGTPSLEPTDPGTGELDNTIVEPDRSALNLALGAAAIAAVLAGAVVFLRRS